MPQPTFSWPALRDLRGIQRYIAERSGPDRADVVTNRIIGVCDLVAERLGAGRPQPELGGDVRAFSVRPYIVFYRLLGDAVEIARVIHERQDVPVAWREGGGDGETS